ncbi:hypothetical protein C8R47DRAFT_1073235 [Mycena vitilis]|nr:hypothetical protein C8R47DRAFT_1073235 [Mycena vitilis]
MIVPHGTIDRTGNETAAVSARAGGIVCESVEGFEVRDRILAAGCAFSSKRERVISGVVEFQIKFFVQDVARRVGGESTRSGLKPVTLAKETVTLDGAPVTWRATAKIEAAETERDGLGKELAEEKQRSQTSTSLLYLDTTILKNDTPFSVQLQKMPRSKDYKLNCSKVGVVQIPVQAKSRETGDKLEGHRNSLTAMLANF